MNSGTHGVIDAGLTVSAWVTRKSKYAHAYGHAVTDCVQVMS